MEDPFKDRCSSFCAIDPRHSSLKSSNLFGELNEWRKTIIGRESGLRRLLPRKLLLALKTFLPSFSSNTRCRQADSWVLDTELYLLGAVRAIVPRGSWEMVVHRCWKHSFGGRGTREEGGGAPNILTGTGKTCPAQQPTSGWTSRTNRSSTMNWGRREAAECLGRNQLEPELFAPCYTSHLHVIGNRQKRENGPNTFT